MLAGDEYPEVEAYLEAMWKQCASQRSDVEASNLMSELGYREKYDPKWYWENADESILNQMVMQCEIKGPMRHLEATQTLVENGDARKFSAELAQKNIGEKAATLALSGALRDMPGKLFKRGLFEMHLVEMYTDRSQKTTGVIIKKRLE